MHNREQNESSLAVLDIPDFMSDEEAEAILNEHNKEVEIDIKCLSINDISCATPGGCSCCQPA